MLAFDYEALSGLGLTPALAGRAATLGTGDDNEGAAPVALVRVSEVHRETLAIHDGLAQRDARALPRLLRELRDEETALAVGDWALLRADAHGDAWVTHRVPPVSHIVRRDGDGRRHPVVSNVDIAFLVMGLDDDFNPRRLERFLALVHGDAISPVVVLTKADVVGRSLDIDGRVAELRARIGARIGGHTPIHAVDATNPEAATCLAGYCERGSTLVMLGSSGAGKSTLTNTLMGSAVQDTGVVRANDGRGMHTTTSRSLHLLPTGACVIDTPGLRTLTPDGGEAAVAGAFADIEALAPQCRFADCRHQAEPGCAVRERVDGDRLRNYHKLLREVRRDTMTPLDRQRQLADWKARGRATKARMKMKRPA